jgi:hypothetical protein
MKSVARLLAALAILSALPLVAQAPAKSCTDTIPKACAKVTFLGEEHDCACFACNPSTKERKVVCTNDDATKKALYKMRDESAGEKPKGEAPKGASR